MAASLLGMSLLGRAYRSIIDGLPVLTDIDPGYFIIEVVVTAAMIAIALRANRMYPLWMAGFQIIALLAHFARGMTDLISPIAYVVMIVGPSYFQIIILGFGIWLHRRREKRHGKYRSWRSSSNHSRDQTHST